MKSLIYSLFLCLALVSFSCSDDSGSDNLTITEFLELNTDLNPQISGTGLHYIINDPGTAPNPTIRSSVTIDYDGYFLGGGSFEGGNDVTFPLITLIAGWQEGLQLIGSGGSITLLIPSRLAYGSSGAGSIPPNTDIGFDIELKSFR
jgi:FKBP-type peptidyl-prolyl cis-trans isomerase FkpA